MTRVNALAVVLILSATFLGCSKKTSPQTEEVSPSAAPRAAAGHAPVNVKPGSHDDWCGEHQVPESQCTRCNPSLSAAFKATGDWCEEHGLPESQCMKCNPNLKIVRPSKPN